MFAMKKKSIAIAFCSILLIGCGNTSTDSGITKEMVDTTGGGCYGDYVRQYADLLAAYKVSSGGTSIGGWGKYHHSSKGTAEGRVLPASCNVGVYEGTLELQATADAIGTGPKSDNDSVTVEVEITENAIVYMIIDETTLEGIIDDEGNFELEFSINDFGSLIDEKSRDTLKAAGCSLGEQFAKVEGQVTPPTMSGEVSGELSCKVLLVTIGTLEVSGTLTATM